LRVEASYGRRVMVRYGLGGMVWQASYGELLSGLVWWGKPRQARFVTASYGSVGHG